MAKRRFARGPLLIVALVGVMSSLAICAPMATAGLSTFGKTTVGATWGGGFFADLKRVNAYSLSQTGKIRKLRVYLGRRSVRGSELLNGVIYADSTGSPGVLLATSRTLRFSNTNWTGWYDLPLPKPLLVQPGKYWLGVIAGGTTRVAGYRWDWVRNSRVLDANRYASGPSKRFGSYYVDDREMSLYATYSPLPNGSGSTAVPATPVTVPPATTASAAKWFGAFLGAGGCADTHLWSGSNPTPANGYTSSDGGFQGCVPDPDGSGQTVLEQKVTPKTCGWSCEQRMDWQSTHFITNGADLYISIPIMVPTSQSLIGGNGWGVQFNEQFGQPTNGSPSNSLAVYQVSNGLVFGLGGNVSGRSGGGSNLWFGSGPANDSQWHDFIEHMVFSTNPAVGEMQLWEDGNPITFNGPGCNNVTGGVQGCGTTTLHYSTLIPGATDQSNNWVQIDNYRNNSPASYTSTFFHGPAAVGPTYASVYNTLVNPPYGP
jgi:hypothetical protein